MWLVSVVTYGHVVHDLRRTILVLNTPDSDLSTIGELLLCIEVKVIILHHTVVMTVLSVCS